MADDNVLEHGPPHDIQAEMGVLGCMLLDREAAFTAREKLGKDSFYKLAHQDIFDVVLKVLDEHNSTDLTFVRDELKRRSLLEKAGGSLYLMELAESVPNPANFEYFIEVVSDYAMRRRLLEASQMIQRNANDHSREVQNLLDDAERTILAIRQDRDQRQAESVDGLLRELIERIEQKHRDPKKLSGLPTGFYDLDDKTDGLQPGEMIVVAARPSVGKTSFALNILHHTCVVEQKPALFFSFEMRSLQIVSNFLCLHARINSHRLRQGRLDEQKLYDLERAIRELQGIPLFIDDSPVLTVMDIRARARRMLNRQSVELVVVDYLQLIKPVRDRDNRPTEVAEISHGLKSLARELRVPLVAVAQLRRDAEEREPRMSDLRESGAIEQDADVILLLHRPRTFDETDVPMGGPTDAELYLVKQRNGPVGKINLIFQGECFRFENRAR